MMAQRIHGSDPRADHRLVTRREFIAASAAGIAVASAGPFGHSVHGTDTVKLRGNSEGIRGIPVSELTADQRALAEQVMEDVLKPFREVDRQESMDLIRKNGFDQLHFSFYKNEDIGDDGVWDVW